MWSNSIKVKRKEKHFSSWKIPRPILIYFFLGRLNLLEKTGETLPVKVGQILSDCSFISFRTSPHQTQISVLPAQNETICWWNNVTMCQCMYPVCVRERKWVFPALTSKSSYSDFISVTFSWNYDHYNKMSFRCVLTYNIFCSSQTAVWVLQTGWIEEDDSSGHLYNDTRWAKS